jgi:hypothetical protein
MDMIDPKTLVDSVVDGGLSALQFFPKTADNFAGVCQRYASNVNGSIEQVKQQMPDNPGIIPGLLGTMVSETVGAIAGGIKAPINAAESTVSAIQSQIRRGTQAK